MRCLMETASASRGSSVSKRPTPGALRRTTWVLLTATTALTPVLGLAQTLPTGGSVAQGNATIQTPQGSKLTVVQDSNNAVINWQSFSIDEGAQVDFIQPGQNSAVLNRVTGETTSQIYGSITADGAVHIVNPNGIFIGPTGQINTAGFVASTLGITDEDFMAGRYDYNGEGASASVQNQGRIGIVSGGYAALLGGQVSNSGVISVPMGRIGLGSGERITLNLSGDNFMQVALPTNSDDPALEALVENAGTISANGGRVEMLAATAQDAARRVVNMSGVVEATTVSGTSGSIIFGGTGGGSVQVTGQVSAAADPEATVTRSGGFITISGGEIDLIGATLNVSGTGDAGWISIGEDPNGVLPIADRVLLDEMTMLIADATLAGSGGTIWLTSNALTQFDGSISARGGDTGGDGGFVDIFSDGEITFDGFVDTIAPLGEWGSVYSTSVQGNYSNSILEPILEANGLVSLEWFDQPEGEYIRSSGELSWSSDAIFQIVTDSEYRYRGTINAPNGSFYIDAGSTIITERLNPGDPLPSINVDTFAVIDSNWVEVGELSELTVNNFVIGPDASFLRATGGSGTTNDPYVLTDIFGLQGMAGGDLVGAHYALGNDIDASATQGWIRPYDLTDLNSDLVQGFEPIADFGGSLDGQDYTIDGLYINRSSTENAGPAAMFLDIRNVAEVENFTLNLTDVIGLDAAGLAYVNWGLISDVEITGNVSMIDHAEIIDGTLDDPTRFYTLGGVAGRNEGVIRNVEGSLYLSYYTDTKFPIHYDIGGITGINATTGTIDNVALTDTTLSFVVSSGDSSFDSSTYAGPIGLTHIGGIAGYSSGTITNVSFSGTMAHNSFDTGSLGGLVGGNNGLVADSSVDLFLDTMDETVDSVYDGWETPLASFGGAIGDNYDGGVVERTTASGFFAIRSQRTDPMMPPEQSMDVGGFVGSNAGIIRDSSASTDILVLAGEVDGTVRPYDTLNIGNFYGYNYAGAAAITNSTGTGTVTIEPGAIIRDLNGQEEEVIDLNPPIPVILPPQNPTDDIELVGLFEDTTDAPGTDPQAVEKAQDTLAEVGALASQLVGGVERCSVGEGAEAVLACLAEGLEEYGSKLDALKEDLPPGMDNIGGLIDEARSDVLASREKAIARLADATTEAQRSIIQQEAIDEARATLQNTQREIRKAISLIRVSDPELIALQTQQIETVAASFGQLDISLSRVTEL